MLCRQPSYSKPNQTNIVPDENIIIVNAVYGIHNTGMRVVMGITKAVFCV